MSQPGVIIDSGSFVVTKANVDAYDNDRQAKTDSLKQDFDSKYLSCK
jgi:ribose transport system substrate-binding protein